MAMALVTQEELRGRLASGIDLLILDVRGRGDYDRSSLKIRGAVHLSPDEVLSLSQQLSKGKEIIVYSTTDGEETGPNMARQLRALGFEKAYPLVGGFRDWLNAGLEMEPK